MNRLPYILFATVILAACGGENKDKDKELAKLKKDRMELDQKIVKLEAETGKNKTKKATPVTITPVQPSSFKAFIEVQSMIVGDENINVVSQNFSPAVVTSLSVVPGQRVSKGQVLATLDATSVDQQLRAQQTQVTLLSQLYDKQKKLWEQNIGTEVQLLQAKANYESNLRSYEAAKTQKDMYRIVAPISGVVDEVNVKIGDMMSVQSGVGGNAGIRIVNNDKLKAEANLGENYIGKVQAGDPVTLVFPDINDSIRTKVSYVGQAVNLTSRAFTVQVKLGSSKKLHPNMSCKMKIANYETSNAIVVPVSVIQKTGQGNMLYIVKGNTAKSVVVTTGQNSNGMVEITSGLNAGDKVITGGFEGLDDGEPIVVQ